MVTVLFRPQELPRSTTRKAWTLAYRNYRVTKRQCHVMEEVVIKLLPTMPAHIRDREIEQLINPPIMMLP